MSDWFSDRFWHHALGSTITNSLAYTTVDDFPINPGFGFDAVFIDKDRTDVEPS